MPGLLAQDTLRINEYFSGYCKFDAVNSHGDVLKSTYTCYVIFRLSFIPLHATFSFSEQFQQIEDI